MHAVIPIEFPLNTTHTPVSDFQPLAAMATTPNGVRQLAKVCPSLSCPIWVSAALWDALSAADQGHCQIYPGSLKAHLASLWETHRGIVFCLATGAVVRLIAPLLQDKGTDPAIVVIDEPGQHVISLSGGHQGGADRLTQVIACYLDALPLLTGASNAAGLPGVDVLGIPYGWRKGRGDWTGVSAAIARCDAVEVIQEAGTDLWVTHLPPRHPFQFGFPEISVEQRQSRPQPKARIWISPMQRQFAPESDLPKVQWHPRVLWVGIGCERGTSKALIQSAVQQVCQSYHLAEAAIAGISTLDLKSDEVGLVEYCRDRHLPLECFTAEELRQVPVPNPSEIVLAEVQTPSVAEAAAILSSVQHSEVKSLTSSVPLPLPLRVPKKIIRDETEPGAVTVAIAQAEREYIGHSGRLWLIGTGPGDLDQVTPAAKAAIAQADAVIGYSLYVDLIRPVLRPGQIVEASPITQERQRAERAIDLAWWGLTVAVISSGDCGIYGMAGLVLEQLHQQHWDGQVPAVQVFPGISALQSAASRVGAPLMHDFCAISLSDLLTPWDVIEKRLTAAAQADFVTALYNPKSKTRTNQIAIAQRIFLQYRDADTPVALVKSAYRDDEQMTLTTLAQLLDQSIDMLTTVLIGNRSTLRHGDWLITPRGYLGFGGGK